jgi:hypothetical protein
MKIRHYSLPFLLLMFLPVNSMSSGGPARIEQIKKDLRFKDWAGAAKDGLQYLFLTINIPEIIGSGYSCRYTIDTAAGCTLYKVGCYTNNNKNIKPGFEDVAFTVTLFPDVASARESVIELISTFSSPAEYLAEKWQKENAPFGDKAFGNNLWCMGNAVIRRGNRHFNQTIVADVFSKFENYFRQKTVSNEMDILPLQGSVGDGDIRLDSLPDKSTVFITAPADYDLTVGEKNKTLKINKQPDMDVNINDIHVNTIRSKKKTE